MPATFVPERDARWIVLRDRPYATVSLLNAVLVMNGGILVVALPIWLSQRTQAPVATYPVLLLVNTVAVVLGQVRVSRGCDDVHGGAAALRRCGILLAACCVIFASASALPPCWATAVLVAGTLVHVLGEMLYSAGAWSLSFGLAPDHAQGQYQGMFGVSTQLGAAVTPLAVTTLIIGLGPPGWLVFAALMAAAGLAAPATARWAERETGSSRHLVIPAHVTVRRHAKRWAGPPQRSRAPGRNRGTPVLARTRPLAEAGGHDAVAR